MKKCHYCAEEIQDEAIKCRHCGEMLNAHRQLSPGQQERRSENPVGLKTLGTLLVLGGLGAIVFSFTLDTTVAVPTQTIMGQTIGGGRVNNLGLMAERQNILTGGGFAFIGGLVLTALGGGKSSNSAKTEPVSSQAFSWIARIVVYGFLAFMLWIFFGN